MTAAYAWRFGLAGALLTGTLAGCASQAASGPGPAAAVSAPASVEPAPEDLRVSASAVAAGLTDVKRYAADVVAAGSDKDRARQAQEKIEPAWASVEGTVKANDVNTYLAFEDNFALLGDAVTDADMGKAASASQAIARAADAYLVRFPADGSPAAPSASPSATPSTDAASGVTAGLRDIVSYAATAAATTGSDKAAAKAALERIEPAWRPVEDEIKGHDQGTYLRFEDNFAVLEKAVEEGDAAKARAAADAISAAVEAYLQKFPG